MFRVRTSRLFRRLYLTACEVTVNTQTYVHQLPSTFVSLPSHMSDVGWTAVEPHRSLLQKHWQILAKVSSRSSCISRSATRGGDLRIPALDGDTLVLRVRGGALGHRGIREHKRHLRLAWEGRGKSPWGPERGRFLGAGLGAGAGLYMCRWGAGFWWFS